MPDPSLRITAFCQVANKSSMKKEGKKNMAQVTMTQITISGVRAMREAADFLSGVPRGTVSYLFAETGVAFQEMQISLPRRALRATGHIELRNKDGSGTLARLEITNAIARKFRFELDTPDDTGPTLDTQFNLMWKTAGDESATVEPLLDQKCYLDIEFREQPRTTDMFSNSPVAEEEAGQRAKLDRKRRASGEKESDNDGIPAADPIAPPAAKDPEPAPTNVVPIKPAKKTGGRTLAQLEKEAKEVAAKHPRKDPPKPPGGPRGGGRGGPRHH